MKNLIFIIIFSLMGCATKVVTPLTDKLEIGMSKFEILEIFGNPQRISASAEMEILEYDIVKDDASSKLRRFGLALQGYNPDYASPVAYEIVRLVLLDGKLDSYITTDKSSR